MAGSCFLPVVLEEADRTKLNSMVPFTDFVINGRKGILVSDDCLATTINILNLEKFKNGDTVSSPFVDIMEVVPKGLAVKTYDCEQMKSTSSFVDLTRWILTPVIKKPILLEVPHGKTVVPKEDGKFRVFFWSSPILQAISKENSPRKIYGIAVSLIDWVFKSSGQGIVFTDGLYEVAELVGNNLYIHHDLCHHGSVEELAIYEKLLLAVVNELAMSPEERLAKARAAKEKKRAESRKAYIQNCAGRIEKQVAQCNKDITNQKNAIVEAEKSLVSNLRALKDSQDALLNFNQLRAVQLEKLGLEYDKLVSLPKIIDVVVRNDGIEVFTEVLDCVDPRSKLVHEIGRFKIVIYNTGQVYWFNLTRQIGAYWTASQAPHVNNDGVACLGNIREALPQLIANYEFAVAAMLAIQFVESVNVDDSAGKLIDRWPLKPTVKEVAA